MTLYRVRLSDSINLSVIKTDRFKSELLTFTISLPLTAKNSVYNMLLAGILKRGTTKYPDISALNTRLDELYASSVDIRSARLGKNLTLTITADMLDERFIPDGTDLFDGVLEIVEETLLRPRLENGCFPGSIFEQEKRFLLDSINASVNNTRAYASLRLSELMLANDKEFPTVEKLKTIIDETDKKELTDFFFSTMLSSPLEIFYIGRTSAEELKCKILARFSQWNAKAKFSPILPYAEPVCEYMSVTEKMPVSQGKLAMGFKVNTCICESSDEHYAAILLNELFGGSAASKLFMNVREKLSLCYYCSSSYNQYMGTMTVSSGIENKNRELAQTAILNELEDIRQGKFTDAELFAAKRSLENSYRQIYDNPYDLQSFYENRSFFGFSESVEIVREKVAQLNKEDVIQIANKIVCDSVFYVEATKDGEEYCDEE